LYGSKPSRKNIGSGEHQAVLVTNLYRRGQEPEKMGGLKKDTRRRAEDEQSLYEKGGAGQKRGAASYDKLLLANAGRKGHGGGGTPKNSELWRIERLSTKELSTELGKKRFGRKWDISLHCSAGGS